jgi:hypothetical protein
VVTSTEATITTAALMIRGQVGELNVIKINDFNQNFINAQVRIELKINQH